MLTIPKGTPIVFDAPRQAWFPDDGQSQLTAENPTKATLLKGVTFETRIGMRSAEIQFEIVERFQPVE